MASNVPADGTNPVQCVEKTFHLSRNDKDLLSKPDYAVQAWCMLFNDKVPFRMQWPQYVDLQVNGMPVRAISRPGSQLLGANGRDDGPNISQCIRDGINKIFVSGCDSRIFCFGVRLVKRRSLQQILSMIPKESDGELFEDALARVRRCIGGGEAENADSDSDLEVVTESITVNLRCPVTIVIKSE